MGCVAQTSPNVWWFVADSARKWGFSGSHYLVGARTEVVVAMDWTSFARDQQDTVVLSMLTGHGRATPDVDDGEVVGTEGADEAL